MSAAVQVASAEAVASLETRVLDLQRQVAELQKTTGTTEVFTPKEIAHRFKIRRESVYAALESGALVAEKRPARGGFAYHITLADARAWYATNRKTNQ